MKNYKNNVGAGPVSAQKGITLIALVITIIVMLILVAVTISMAINGGLFQKAGEAVGETQNKIDEEQTLASGKIQIDGVWYDSIDDYLADSKKDTNPGVLETIGTNKYEINSIEDLVALSYSVNSGEETYLGKTIELGKNLDFKSDSSYANPEAKYVLESATIGYKPDETGTSIKEQLLGDNGFIPIGTQGSQGYYGTIEGNNRTIKNMKITSVTTFGGLIGTTKAETEINISNLGMEDENISCNNLTGGIIGYDSNGITITIDNCYTTGTISGYQAGGIIGQTAGVVTTSNSYNNASIVSTGMYAGGIIAGASGGEVTIENCYNTGIISSAFTITGGIIGYGNGVVTIENCYNAGKIVTGSSGPSGWSGGIVGGTGGTVVISNCYNLGICDFEYGGGGVVGNASSATVTNCYNTGTVTSANNGPAGGISGNGGTITNCYNTGTVTGPNNAPAGGICGAGQTITNCYNTGIVTSQNEALIGGISGYGGTITNCYFMKGTASVGVGNSGTGDTTEKEEADMQTDTFLEELKGSTDNTAWKREDTKNNKMPILSWQ